MQTLQVDPGLERQRQRHRRVVLAGRVALPVVVLLAWQTAADRGTVDPFFVSKPTEVFGFLRTALTEASTWENLWVTLQETLIGLGLAAVFGVLVALLFTRAPILHEIARPYLTGLNSLPRIALAPLFTLWLGLGQASKVALVVSICFFIVLGSTMGAIANVDPDLVRLARVLGFSPTRIYTKVLLRWAAPGIFAGLQLALVYAFVGAVGAEMIASRAGMGQQIQYFSGTFDTAGVLGTILLLAIVTSGFSFLMESARRRLGRHELTPLG
jgi:NitT/TauT family transport system permease protein